MGFLQSAVRFFLPAKEEEKREEVVPPAVDRAQIPPNREVVLSWVAPTRPYKRKSSAYYKRAGTIIFVLSILLVLAGQFLLIALIVSIAVFYYVVTSVPPENVKHEIDNYGLVYFGKQYYWKDFKFFSFINDGGDEVLIFDTIEPFPGRLYFVLGEMDKQKVRDVIGQHVALRETPPETIFDKAYRHVTSRLSLDEPVPPTPTQTS